MILDDRSDGPDSASARPAADGRWEFLVTSYMLGAPDGRNLGAPGYSHEFVARLFKPFLQRWGDVVEIRDARRQLPAAIADCRRRGAIPVHFSVLPFQDVCIASDAVNVVVPAWEFPDVPDHPFDDNPQNDWPNTANRADLVLVSGPFTGEALARSGTTTPIRIVPVPTPDCYFAVPGWRPGLTHRIGCRAYVFSSGGDEPPPASRSSCGNVLKRGEKLVRSAARLLLGRRRYEFLSEYLKDRRHAHRHSGGKQQLAALPYPRTDDLELTGFVYTSIFNPDDGRKNWHDLLSASLLALADRDDATLVVKLIAKSARSVRKVIKHYLARGIRHRCRLVFICDFLDDEQMLRLCTATTYYVQATRAEGNCLPLMNYLAAGRPGISPDHSSMGDYFGPDCGFVVASHPEPAAWPHDHRHRLRTTWGRIVWPSLHDQIVASYRLAHERPEEYVALSQRSRQRMKLWAGSMAVATKLSAAFRELADLVAADRVGRPDRQHERPVKSAA